MSSSEDTVDIGILTGISPWSGLETGGEIIAPVDSVELWWFLAIDRERGRFTPTSAAHLLDGALLADLLRQKNRRANRRARNASPPTTPPAIAPACDFDDDALKDGDGEGLGVDELDKGWEELLGEGEGFARTKHEVSVPLTTRKLFDLTSPARV